MNHGNINSRQLPIILKVKLGVAYGLFLEKNKLSQNWSGQCTTVAWPEEKIKILLAIPLPKKPGSPYSNQNQILKSKNGIPEVLPSNGVPQQRAAMACTGTLLYDPLLGRYFRIL